MKSKIYSEKTQALLNTFIQRMKLLNRADNPKLVARIIIKWTQGQTLLTKKLLQYVLQSEPRIYEGEEARAVEKVIREDLLREFKKDNLTLNIRKKLYQKDLEDFLQSKAGMLKDKDANYILEIQKKLGLNTKDVKSINNNTIRFDYRLDTINSNYKNHFDKEQTNFKQRPSSPQLANYLESLDPEEKSNLVVRTLSNPAIENQEIKSAKAKKSRQKWLFLLGIPLIVLSIIGVNLVRNNSTTTEIQPNLNQGELCIDLTSRQSPRMSLGEKFLTKQHSQLNSSSLLPFYEGMAAFARCEFSVAQQKYQESLAIDKNNPEALVYLNNAAAIAQDHFKIAVSIPLGTQPDIAWEILRGVAQAQSEVNQQGGINQKLLLVQIVNDDNNPDVVKQLAKQLAADQSILAVIGHNDSNSSLAGAKIYEREKLVMISPTSASGKLSEIGSHIMGITPSVAALANKLADYASAKSLTNIAVCADSQDSASSSFAQEFMTKTTSHGGQIHPVKCDLGKEDLQPEVIVTQAVAENADALLLVPSVNRMNKAIAVAQVNQQKLPLLGNHSLYTYETIELGQNAIAGMVIPSPWLSDNTQPSDFSQAAMKYWGGQVNWRTATAYDALKAISQGLNQSNDRASLQSVLTQTNFSVNGATGNFYLQQGDRQGMVQLAYVTQSSDNSSEYQFSKLEL